MRITLFDCTDDCENKLGAFAAVCRGKDVNFNNKEANAKVLASVLKHNHLSVLRFAYATFLIEGISRACSHQLVRHAHFGFLQESQRSVRSIGNQIIPVSFSDDIKIKWGKLHIQIIDLYNECNKKEDARYILPQSTPTRLLMTGNFQAWEHFLKLRLDDAAQWEIKEVATKINDWLHTIAPNIF